MATPSISSTVNFVKKYPITLCGFSLLFMPSVHRLLLYFTPLLLSTAIFIVAMMSWGPSMSLEGGKRKDRRNEWAFNGSLKIYDEEEAGGGEDEEEREAEEVSTELSQKGKTSEEIMKQEDVFIKGKGRDVELMKLEPKLRPDFDEESNRVGTASNASEGRQAEPDPDLGENSVEKAPNGALCMGQAAKQDPDLDGDWVSMAPTAAAAISSRQADPEPEYIHGDHDRADLGGDSVGSTATYDALGDIESEPDPDLHDGDQHVEPAPENLSAEIKRLYASPHHHRVPVASHDDHNHAEPAVINPNQHAVAEPDPDLNGESAVQTKSEERAVEIHDLHAAISELRQKLKSTPYTDDPRGTLSQQIAERLQAAA